MKIRLQAAIASLALAGCTSRMVMLVAPVKEVHGTCFEQCQALFGARPTLNCSQSKAPLHPLVCTYDGPSRPGADDRSTRPRPEAAAESACRADCARLGFEKVDGCWSAQTLGGEPAMACEYRVGYH